MEFLELPELPELPEFEIHWFELVESTNKVLWSLLQQGAGAGTVVIALQQQAGRGQWGRQWSSAPGGLYLSLALTPNLAIEQGRLLTLCSAVGIASILRQQGILVQIKWLNDLVVQGRKLGGILTETRVYQERIHQAVIGVGINWRNPTPEVGINLQSILNQLTRDQLHSPSGVGNLEKFGSLETVATIVLQGLRLGYELGQQQGTRALIKAYEALLLNRGQVILIKNQPGTIIGITASGQLRVQLHSSDLHPLEQTEIVLDPGEISLGYARLNEGQSIYE